MFSSELLEAADLLDEFGKMLRENPQEFTKIASGTNFQRHATAYYLQHLAIHLRGLYNDESKDGQG